MLFCNLLLTLLLVQQSWATKGSDCLFDLVESIPENLSFEKSTPSHMKTYDAFTHLLKSAQKEVDLTAFYWTLRSQDVGNGKTSFPSAKNGEDLLKLLNTTGLKKGVNLTIAQETPDWQYPQNDSKMLKNSKAATVVDVNMRGLFDSVLHTKMFQVDDDKMFVGSPNMDFRSLTQVKELGVMLQNCSVLVEDAKLIFKEYLCVGTTNQTTKCAHEPEFNTTINMNTPASITLNGTQATAYLSSSPPNLTANGRTDDIDAIVSVINDAQEFIDIAVMDYFPTSLYKKRGHNTFWPVIDDALRKAAFERNVAVRLLGSHWNHTRPSMLHWLKSLADISYDGGPKVETRMFVVPSLPKGEEIPFTRVNHNKYMVTDRVAYIGTSNWSQDYFNATAGVGLVVNESMSTPTKSSLRSQLSEVFDRDWNSTYAWELTKFTSSAANLLPSVFTMLGLTFAAFMGH